MHRQRKRTIFNREVISYTFWGVLTTVLNIVIFQIGVERGADYRVANVIALFTTKLAAYVVNKQFIFRRHCKNLVGLVQEIGRYIISRSVTMFVDYWGLIILVEILMLDKQVGKYIITCLVVITNYILGKKKVLKDVKKI